LAIDDICGELLALLRKLN